MTLRKRIVPPHAAEAADAPQHWVAVEQIAEVEVSSEDPQWPVDGALIEGSERGWRAAAPGEQKLHIRFDQPRPLSLIHLAFHEAEHERVQEFALAWSSDGGRVFQPLVRQQFVFSPGGATRETEDYAVRLENVTNLALHIIPDMSRRPVVATLAELRIR
jgi:hypothetical protein